MDLTQITNLHANGGLNRVENETLGIYQIGNLDTRRINVGANIKHVRVQQRPNTECESCGEWGVIQLLTFPPYFG